MRSLNLKYIPELDQLRGLAALLVLIFHAVAGMLMAGKYMEFVAGPTPVVDNPLKLIVANGFTGVALFFVISGFLFTWGALQTEKLDWKKFYINRFLRIFPLYLLVIAVAFSLTRQTADFGQFIQGVIGFGNLTDLPGDFARVLWTISIELQFYFIFPLLIGLLRRNGVRYIAGLIAILVILRLIAWMDQIPLHDAVYWTLFGRLDQFLIGMMAAWLVYKRGWLSTAVARVRWAVTARLAGGLLVSVGVLLGLLWLYTTMGWKYGDSWLLVVWPTLEATAWTAIGGFYIALVRRHPVRLVKPLQWVGMVSYSLYLLHYPIVQALHRSQLWIEIPGHKLASGLLTATLEVLPISLLVAALSYYVIEKPPLELRRQYATYNGKSGPGQPPAASGSDA